MLGGHYTSVANGCLVAVIAELSSSTRDQMAAGLKYLLSDPLRKSLVTANVIETEL